MKKDNEFLQNLLEKEMLLTAKEIQKESLGIHIKTPTDLYKKAREEACYIAASIAFFATMPVFLSLLSEWEEVQRPIPFGNRRVHFDLHSEAENFTMAILDDTTNREFDKISYEYFENTHTLKLGYSRPYLLTKLKDERFIENGKIIRKRHLCKKDHINKYINERYAIEFFKEFKNKKNENKIKFLNSIENNNYIQALKPSLIDDNCNYGKNTIELIKQASKNVKINLLSLGYQKENYGEK